MVNFRESDLKNKKVAVFWDTVWCHTSNVTGHHRGVKRKLRAGYRAPSLKWMSCPERLHFNARKMLRRVYIVECGIAHFLCAMHLFEVWPSIMIYFHPHPLCAIFHFCRTLHCWASPWRKVAYSVDHALTQLIWCPGNRSFCFGKCSSYEWAELKRFSRSKPHQM